MAKTFYTEYDIDELAKRGVMSLEIGEDVVLTALAYEKANKLGMKLVQNQPYEVPGAPVRPYISQAPRSTPAFAQPPTPAPAAPVARTVPPVASPAPVIVTPPAAGGTDLQNRIRSAVIANLGSQVDAVLLDNIINRVLSTTGLK
ncbi:MAG TPA: hypothetical protein VMS73_01920 [Anaerolineaceae bacterium]|nr:hypothetical protein [Anaerolineaceae bacterium]